MVGNNESSPSWRGDNASQTARRRRGCRARTQPADRGVFLAQHYFTVNFSHENQKALELRTEDAKDCDEWVAAIAHARYVSPQSRQKGWAQGAILSKPEPQEEGEEREPWKTGRVPQRGPECGVVRGCGEHVTAPQRPHPGWLSFQWGLSTFGGTEGPVAKGRQGSAQTHGHWEPGLTSPWATLSPVD